ncbi:MAG: hypothetical protein GF368_01745 [Candidatus Aenigmarchaeota archaeon]|nr:hypothetical protein [Candidatus Aenigmarchaeota archaeon]
MKRFKKVRYIFITILLSLLSCGEPPELIRIEEGKKFIRWEAVKEFEIQRRYLKWILPIKGEFFGMQVSERDEKEYKLFICNASGEEINKTVVKNGQGPNEITGLVTETLMLSKDGRTINFYDGGYYLKSIDTESLEISTIGKISNRINKYGSQYYIGHQGTTSLETNNDLTITSFESTGFFKNHVYYLVTYKGFFNGFRVITPLKKNIPMWLEEDYNIKKNGFIVDYYQRLRWARLFSIDWKRDMIYVIPDIEKAEIERVSFNGQKTRIHLDIDQRKYKIRQDKFELYFSWYKQNLPKKLEKLLDFKFRIPPHAPALQGIKVIENWLLVITGNRDWEKKENEVLVFLLPSLEYKGCFKMPFPTAPYLNLIWGPGYFSSRSLIQHEDEYMTLYEIFRYKIK